MALGLSERGSRRGLLAGAMGAVAGVMAATVAGAGRALAAGDDGQIVHVGDSFVDAQATTTLSNSANNNTVLALTSDPANGFGRGTALYAVSDGYGGLKKLYPQSEAAVGEQPTTTTAPTGPPNATGTSRITKDTERVGGSLYRYASLPFEIASILLLVAIIGSVMLARTLRQEASADDIDPESLQELSARDPQLAAFEAQSDLEI